MKEDLKQFGYMLVNYLERELEIKITLSYKCSNDDFDGRTYCPANVIIINDNQDNWEWLRECIVHESAHRLDHKFRGPMHHNPKYEHDRHYDKCYHIVMEIAKNSPYW